MSEADDLPIWLRGAILELAAVDPGTVELMQRTLTSEVDIIRFVGDQNGVIGSIWRSAGGWAGPVGLSIERIDQARIAGRVPSFHAQVAPNGRLSDRHSGSSEVAHVKVKRPED